MTKEIASSDAMMEFIAIATKNPMDMDDVQGCTKVGGGLLVEGGAGTSFVRAYWETQDALTTYKSLASELKTQSHDQEEYLLEFKRIFDVLTVVQTLSRPLLDGQTRKQLATIRKTEALDENSFATLPPGLKAQLEQV